MAFLSGWSTRTRTISDSWLSLGVSATVLPPIPTQSMELISFRVDRNGIARLETTTPIAGAVSLIVMSTISSSANAFVPVSQAPALVKATHRTEWLEAATRSTESRASRWYEVDLGSPPVGSEVHDVLVRISYLIVPGT